MGVTTRRAGFGALVLAAALLPLRTMARHDEIQPAIDRNDKLDSLRGRMQIAQAMWTTLQERDAAIALIASDSASTVPRITQQGFRPGSQALAAESLITRLWRRIGPPAANISTSVLIYNGTAHSDTYSGTLIQASAGRTHCVAIVDGSQFKNDHVWLSNWALDAALAPCVLWSAFGPPGPGIARWLTDTRYAGARSNNWLIMPKDFSDRKGPWAWWYNSPRRGYRVPALYRAFAATGLEAAALRRPPPYEYGASGLRCIVGDRDACAVNVLNTDGKDDSGIVPPDLTATPRSWGTTLTIGTLRPPQRSLLSAMIADFGRERFRRFWTSTRSFEAAFQDAFGQPLGAWTARWARREWNATFNAQYGGSEILLGVTLRPSWALLVIGWTAIALLAASWVAKRRTA